MLGGRVLSSFGSQPQYLQEDRKNAPKPKPLANTEEIRGQRAKNRHRRHEGRWRREEAGDRRQERGDKGERREERGERREERGQYGSCPS